MTCVRLIETLEPFYPETSLQALVLYLLHQQGGGGRLSYKPPIYDINAPDLYIPLIDFGTYVVLFGFSLGLQGKFTPEALNWLFMKGIVGWFLQVSLLKWEGAETPLLDIVAYAGYAFTGLRLVVLCRIIVSYSYYFLMSWTCLCMGIVLVKTKKRVLFSEVRSFDSSRHHYLLLFIVLAQFPLFIWLGNITTINGESTIFIPLLVDYVKERSSRSFIFVFGHFYIIYAF
ncbi:putative Yif1 family protein [Helianthus annuus]|uniref:Yif1 family protein n=1 Tax=Helianthus annuus TaxID=4232 RepID=A0A9K3J824_HELAN|nr:putative Yif1 family protein [Helianthus annuus]